MPLRGPMITAYTLFCYRVRNETNIRSIPPSRKFVCPTERVRASELVPCARHARMSDSFLVAVDVRAVDASARFRELRACFVGKPYCPLDADTVDLALFAVGWRWLVHDLRLGLGDEVSAGVEAALADAGVHAAFGVRDNLVSYKKVRCSAMPFTCHADAVHMPCTRRAHAVHMPCTCRAHAVHMPCTCDAHATQVLLGIYRSGVCLSHDLRRLATFFRTPQRARTHC